jgi:prefoldin subunit 5
MPNVTLSRALKVKSRLVSRLRELQEFINKYNSLVSGAERPSSVMTAYEESKAITQTLCDIKAAIQIANVPIQTKIFTLAEAKSLKTFLQRLNTTHGTAALGYSGETTEYDSEIKGAYVNDEIKRLTKEIESLQDQIDEFNATTLLEIPEVPE